MVLFVLFALINLITLCTCSWSSRLQCTAVGIRVSDDVSVTRYAP